MARSAAQTRQRILDAAYALFWRQGFLRVSMDEIAGRTNVTKRTLYQHFRSKDDLITATLAHSSELAIATLERIRLPMNREAMIDSLFGQIEDWAAKPRCPGRLGLPSSYETPLSVISNLIPGCCKLRLTDSDTSYRFLLVTFPGCGSSPCAVTRRK